MIFYFSGSGNSKWVAEEIASVLDDTLVYVPDVLCDDTVYHLDDGERLGFVFPVYSWGIQPFFEEFIRNLKIENVQYVYFVCTCGDDTGLTREYFCCLAGDKGWKVSLGYSVQMPNTYVCLPGFDVDPVDVRDRKLSESKVRVRQIISNLRDYACDVFDVYPGAFPWVKSKLIRPLFNKYLISSKYFSVSEKCISCGICVNVCPMKNIVIGNVNNHPEWLDKCVGCLSCYHHCPQKAIDYGMFSNGKGQYYYKK